MKSILLIGIFAAAVSFNPHFTFSLSSCSSFFVDVLQITIAHGVLAKKQNVAIPENVYIIKQHDVVNLPAPLGYYEIDDLNKAMKFLQTSCESVKKLLFNGKFMSFTERITVSEAIIRHCAETLIELEFYEAGNPLLLTTHQTFLRVRTLKVNNDILPPNMQIARIYPALQKLSILSSPGQEWTDDNWEYIQQMLPSISYIRQLEIIGEANPILKSIAEHLSNLEALAIGYDGAIGVKDSMHFSTVKELKLDIKHGRSPVHLPLPFTFDRLEVLNLRTFAAYPFLSDWLGHNVNLQSITTQMNADDQFLDVVGHLPTLKHATFAYRLELPFGAYLNSMANVDTVTFVTRGGHERLADTIPANWKVVDGWKRVDGVGYVLEVARK